MQNELNKRIISSIILIPLVLFLVIKGSFYFDLLLLIIFFISVYEWHHLSKNKSYHYIDHFYLVVSLYFVSRPVGTSVGHNEHKISIILSAP